VAEAKGELLEYAKTTIAAVFEHVAKPSPPPIQTAAIPLGR